MWKEIASRFHQKYRTMRYPQAMPPLPDRYRGLPVVECPRGEECTSCRSSCPTNAIGPNGAIDLGACTFCGQCTTACPHGSIRFTQEHRMSARARADLIVDGKNSLLADPLPTDLRRLLGRSLKLRQVSAGGCNACEADTNVLNTIAFDLGRFGIQFVASPRHADGLLITGPVTPNMVLALRKTYEATPPPKIVIAVGACAISGGLFVAEKDNRGADAVLPVDLFIPGCPPHPLTILDGLLRLIKRF